MPLKLSKFVKECREYNFVKENNKEHKKISQGNRTIIFN